MFFTQDDFKKIQQWLSKNSVRDTEFNKADLPLKGSEEFSMIQDNHNKKITLKDLITNINLLGISDFINVSETFNAKYITLNNAISIIPPRSRKIGQIITFLDQDGNWSIYQFKGESLEVWNNITLWMIPISFITNHKGLFENKPNNPSIGYAYFCIDRKTIEGNNNGIIIYYRGGNIWVDALGRVIE